MFCINGEIYQIIAETGDCYFDYTSFGLNFTDYYNENALTYTMEYVITDTFRVSKLYGHTVDNIYPVVDGVSVTFHEDKAPCYYLDFKLPYTGKILIVKDKWRSFFGIEFSDYRSILEIQFKEGIVNKVSDYSYLFDEIWSEYLAFENDMKIKSKRKVSRELIEKEISQTAYQSMDFDGEFDKSKTDEIVTKLLAKGKCLEITDFSTLLTRDCDYDIFHNKLGYWWLELNGVPIPMKISLLDLKYDKYNVNCAVHIKPSNTNCRTFKSLKLCTDFDIAVTRFIDNVSDEYVYGNSWEKDGMHFGMTCNVSPEFEDEIEFENNSRVPYYCEWRPTWHERYGFNIAWKPYESDEDLSVWFYIT